MLIVLIALGFVAAMVGIALIVEQKKKNSKNHLAMMVANASNEGAHQVLKSYMSKLADGSSARTVTVDKYILKDLFTSLLVGRFGDALRIITQDCTIPQNGELPHCTTIYGIDTIKGPILIYTPSYNATYMGDKRKLPYRMLKNSSEVLEDYVEDNRITTCSELKIAIPVTMEFTDPLYESILSFIKEAELEDIYEEGEASPSRVAFYSLNKDTHHGYRLSTQYRDIKPLSKQLLSASYNDVNVSYEGKQVSIPMGDATDLINVSLKNNENVFIFGSLGSGKTTLSEEIARRMSIKSRTAVVFISPGMLDELQKVEILPSLIAEINKLREDVGITNTLFVIDEAEQLLAKPKDGIHSITNSFMLSMLDGQVQKLLNCTCLLTFNCPPDQLNEAAFRDQRMGMEVHLTNLPTEKAANLVGILREENPTMVFDEHYWKKLQGQSSIALASVYKCFVPPSKQRVIGDIMRRLSGEPELSRVAAPKPPLMVKAPIITTSEPLADIAPTESNANNHHKNGKHKHKHKSWPNGGNQKPHRN